MWDGSLYLTANPDPAALIGERLCANCGETLFRHCEVRGHWPCCPGQCPGEPRGRGGNYGGGRPRKTETP